MTVSIRKALINVKWRGVSGEVVPDLARLPNKSNKCFLSVRMGSCTSGNIRVVSVMRLGRMVLMSPQGKHSYIFLEQCLDLTETLELHFVQLYTFPFWTGISLIRSRSVNHSIPTFGWGTYPANEDWGQPQESLVTTGIVQIKVRNWYVSNAKQEIQPLCNKVW
jgi:hypothetical protein